MKGIRVPWVKTSTYSWYHEKFWALTIITFLSLHCLSDFLVTSYILKQQWCLSVCVDKNWAVPGRFFQSLSVPCGVCLFVVTGRARQPLRGAGRGAISIKEILGENQGTCI